MSARRVMLSALTVLAVLAVLALLVVAQTPSASSTSSFAPYSSSFHVATIVTDVEKDEFKTMVRIASKFGTHIKAVKDVGVFGHGGKGWGQRVKAMRRYLSLLPPRDIVMFIDGYDVLIAASPDRILAAFAQLVGDRIDDVVVFNAESNCFPYTELADTYPESKTPYKYLNGGGCIGRVDVFAKLLDKHMDFSHPEFDKIDDQGEFTKIFLYSGGDIMLDTGNKIFNCMFAREKDLEHHPGRGWYNMETDTYPSVFHANGSVPQRMLFDTMAPLM